ncbi:MAG: carboxypeptidase-like regulatory domain-containing protein [Saprospiraceae bacterium]
MKNRLTVVTIFLLSISSLYGQPFTAVRIEGFVKDEKTMESLPYALVSSHAGGDYADENGYFSYKYTPENETDSVLIQYIGYKTVRIAPHRVADKPITIYLTNANLLPEVVVLAPLI